MEYIKESNSAEQHFKSRKSDGLGQGSNLKRPCTTIRNMSFSWLCVSLQFMPKASSSHQKETQTTPKLLKIEYKNWRVNIRRPGIPGTTRFGCSTIFVLHGKDRLPSKQLEYTLSAVIKRKPAGLEDTGSRICDGEAVEVFEGVGQGRAASSWTNCANRVKLVRSKSSSGICGEKRLLSK